MKEYKEKLEHLEQRFQVIDEKTDTDELQKQIARLEAEAGAPNFWDNQRAAQKHMKKLGGLKNELEEVENLRKSISDLESYIELIEDEHVLEDKLSAEKDFKYLVKELEEQIDNYEIKLFLSGKYDRKDAIISIFAGQGGTEANDWTEMLMRMYLRYFERKDWDAEVTDMVQGTETGISSVTIEVSGLFAYGMLKGEHGTHRLVRISPFNAQGLRQTSFAGVEVMPVVDDEVDIAIPDSDLEFKAVRSGGPGGQSVNKTSSAVQLKHIPTGIQVSASSLKSQHQNREAAMRQLKAKLAAKEEAKVQKEIEAESGEHKKAAWGNQIRNYILHPYNLVKDLRTEVETSDTEAVLDGDLDVFVDAEVRR